MFFSWAISVCWTRLPVRVRVRVGPLLHLHRRLAVRVPQVSLLPPGHPVARDVLVGVLPVPLLADLGHVADDGDDLVLAGLGGFLAVALGHNVEEGGGGARLADDVALLALGPPVLKVAVETPRSAKEIIFTSIVSALRRPPSPPPLPGRPAAGPCISW